MSRDTADQLDTTSALAPHPTHAMAATHHTAHYEQEPFIDEDQHLHGDGHGEDRSHLRESRAARSSQIDIGSDRFPFSLVWGPLPVISWIIPWIGHLGIADSEGKVHDFAGPYYIGIDSFMTPIFKYYQFPAAMWQGKESAWDMGVLQSDSEYRKTMHNIFTNNCHHHSARALEAMNLQCGGLQESVPKDMLSAWWLITRKGRFVSRTAWLCTYMPLICTLAIVIFVSVWFSK